MVVEMFDDLFLFILQLHAERIEIGLLGRPESWILQSIMEYIINGVACVDLQFRPIGGQFTDNHYRTNCSLLLACVAYRYLCCHFCLRIVGIRFSRHTIVSDVYQRTDPQLHLAEDTRKAPHVLIFEIASVTPAIHLNSEFVTPLTHVFGHIELCWRHGVLAIAYTLSINP